MATIYEQLANALLLHMHDQRPGQVLFNYVLPSTLSNILCGSSIDPFHISTTAELSQWIDNHLILDDKQCTILAAFHNNHIIWERNTLLDCALACAGRNTR